MVKKHTAAWILADLNRESKLVEFDGQKFILKPQPENPWQFDIDASKCDTADLLVGWVAYLLEMSWAHPVMIRQFVRMVCHTFAIDLAAAYAHVGKY